MLRIHDQIVITEHRAPVRKQDIRVARVAYFAGCESHRFGREELPFLDVDRLAGLGRRYEQIGLAAQKGGYLEHVDVFGGHGGLFRIVDVGHYRYAEFFSDRAQHAQRLQIADAAERVDPRAVGLAVRRFEYIRYPQPLGDPAGRFGHLPEHRLVLDDARAGHQQEHPAVEMPQVGNMAQNFSGIHGSESFLTE